MLVHFVLFWLKKGASERDKAEFRKELESLAAVETAEALYVGAPIPSNRPVVDTSYDFALTVIFRDKAALEAYQVHPLHKAFVEKNRPRWERNLVYDAQ
jgi:hypothetical protein